MTITTPFLNWISNPAYSHPVYSKTSLQIPRSIIDSIAESRIVVLGEMNHFIHEKSDFRRAWITALSGHFPLVLAEELGRSDGFRVNHYLRSGNTEWLDQVPTFGYNADARTDRDDARRGILKASGELYPTAAFKAEQIRFYQTVHNLEQAIELHGFDINGSTTAGYSDIYWRMKSQPQQSWHTQLSKLLAPVTGESILDEIERLEAATQYIRQTGEQIQLGQSEDQREVSLLLLEIDRDIQVMQVSLRFLVETNKSEDYASLNPSLADREQLMKAQIDWLLQSLMPDQKLVLMGHALHLVKLDPLLIPGASPGGGITSSLGHYLVQEHGETMVSIWQLYGSGLDSQPFPDLPNRVSYPEHTLNQTLLNTGGERILTTDAAELLGQSVAVGHMYNSLVELELAAQVDAVHFFPIVSELNK